MQHLKLWEVADRFTRSKLCGMHHKSCVRTAWGLRYVLSQVLLIPSLSQKRTFGGPAHCSRNSVKVARVFVASVVPFPTPSNLTTCSNPLKSITVMNLNTLSAHLPERSNLCPTSARRVQPSAFPTSTLQTVSCYTRRHRTSARQPPPTLRL